MSDNGKNAFKSYSLKTEEEASEEWASSHPPREQPGLPFKDINEVAKIIRQNDIRNLNEIWGKLNEIWVHLKMNALFTKLMYTLLNVCILLQVFVEGLQQSHHALDCVEPLNTLEALFTEKKEAVDSFQTEVSDFLNGSDAPFTVKINNDLFAAIKENIQQLVPQEQHFKELKASAQMAHVYDFLNAQKSLQDSLNQVHVLCVKYPEARAPYANALLDDHPDAEEQHLAHVRTKPNILDTLLSRRQLPVDQMVDRVKTRPRPRLLTLLQKMESAPLATTVRVTPQSALRLPIMIVDYVALNGNSNAFHWSLSS